MLKPKITLTNLCPVFLDKASLQVVRGISENSVSVKFAPGKEHDTPHSELRVKQLLAQG